MCNGIFFFFKEMSNGLYVLDLDMPINNINTKRIKPNKLNRTYLWHCCLGHINENLISKLLKDRILDSLDFESNDTCRSCLLGKMRKTSFTGTSERSSDLLGLIHTY